ncbi:hypothetical protein P691DRAFT_772106 [Macrolepiota fuliginosa MF-IS2]|uniref:DUF6697 domain-containing protein n=1 Tax=Macrolepiota fuliginosa MF-IS2 TaxID=1400762 RepID=A0A9P5XJK4_9AGAR|nr:hypothetical protein P691DRAFT_772106 [Macrolepiota fuliginosa MF-IS2]
MDDEFFASVLKKWADASQDVVNLKKRLGDVEQERNKCQREVTELKARQRKFVRAELSPAQKPNEIQPLDLDEVGDKLEKARLEYQRRLKELEDARNHATFLEREVEDLRQERTQLQSQLQSGRVQHAEVISELSNLRHERDVMTNKIHQLTLSLEEAERAKAELETQNFGASNLGTHQVGDLQQQMTFLETQIQELKSLASSLEADNVTIRGDLVVARESLHKTKESNKSLLATISQLSRIARNVAGAPDPVPTAQQELPNTKSKGLAAEIPLPGALRTKPAVKEEPKVDIDLSFNDVTIVEEPNNPLTIISPRRLEALASLPVIIPDTDINDDNNKFTRGFTSAAIGGSIQSLIVRVTHSGTDLSKKRNIEEYLCPRLDHNPWCPSTPGQHGYMFVGLGKEKNTYTTPQLRNLFIGLPKRNSKEERYFRYLGVYRVSRVDSLSTEEWKSLHPSVKQNYVHMTKEKNKDPRTKEEIAAAYDAGELLTPCVKLQCVDFDEELYAGLIALRTKHSYAQKARVAKRKSDEDYEDNVHSQKSKRAAKRLAQ